MGDFYQKIPGAMGDSCVKDANMAERPFSIVRASLEQNLSNANPERTRSWRDSLRARLPADKLHALLADLAEGKAWMAQLPDGQCSVPVLPSSDVRLRAAMFLHEALYGKAVAQTEIVKAEQEAKEFESVRALSDEELDREASKILTARQVKVLEPGVEDAQFTISEQPEDWMAKVWAAQPTEEADESD